eukprot:COSAG05_NODE_710_length_7822_cov_18.425353_6_plen_214_part_00
MLLRPGDVRGIGGEEGAGKSHSGPRHRRGIRRWNRIPARAVCTPRERSLDAAAKPAQCEIRGSSGGVVEQLRQNSLPELRHMKQRRGSSTHPFADVVRAIICTFQDFGKKVVTQIDSGWHGPRDQVLLNSVEVVREAASMEGASGRRAVHIDVVLLELQPVGRQRVKGGRVQVCVAVAGRIVAEVVCQEEDQVRALCRGLRGQPRRRHRRRRR